MKDPLLIDSWQTAITKEQRQQYAKVNENWDPCKSLTEAHDRIRALTTANNQLVGRLIRAQAKVDKTEKRLKMAKWQIWLMGLVVSPIMSELAKKVLHWIFR